MKKNESKLVELEFEYLLDFLKNGLFDSYAVSFFSLFSSFEIME